MPVAVMDCLGGGSCAQVCPAKEKALVMNPLRTEDQTARLWDYAMSVSRKAIPMNKFTVKGSQFEQPLLEFSGACAGCGETPYAKLVTQLFGDRMMIANATGCSCVWADSVPSTPYTTNADGHGPAWGNSLFEDNAEYGLGMYLGVRQVREKVAMDVAEALANDPPPADVIAVLQDGYAHRDDTEGTRERADKGTAAL